MIPKDGCRKRTYWTRSYAAKILKSEKKRTGKILLHVYQCPDCNLWHLGKMSESKKKTGRHQR